MYQFLLFGFLFLLFLAFLPILVLKPFFRIAVGQHQYIKALGFFALVALISFILGILASPLPSSKSQVAGITSTNPSPASVVIPSQTPRSVLALLASPSATPITLSAATSSASPSASLSPRPSPSLSGDRDCYHFTNQTEAHDYFVSRGGSSENNIDNLDYDRDGTACEDHKYSN
jgi:hypothetical protein